MIGIYITIIWICAVVIASIWKGGEAGVITFMLGGLFSLMAYLALRVRLVQHSIKKRFISYATNNNMHEDKMDWSQSIVLNLFKSKRSVSFKTFSHDKESVIHITHVSFSANTSTIVNYYGFMKPVKVKKRLLVTQSFFQKLKNMVSLEQVDVSQFKKLKEYSVVGDIFDLKPLEKVLPENIPSDITIAFEDGYVMVFRMAAHMRDSSEDFEELHNLVENIAKAYAKD